MTSHSGDSQKGGTLTGTSARVLVVEDGVIMARDIERRLTTMGYRVVGLSTTGEEAIRKARDVHPDLILMDVHLKGPIDGIQAAEQIRQAADIPIVYATAYSDDATLKRARVTEPFGYVLKPFEERELRTIIEIALYRAQMDRRLRESEQRYRAIAEMSPGFAYSVSVRPDGSMATDWVTDEFRKTGLSVEALSDLSHHVHPDDKPVVKNRLAHLLSGEQGVAEYRIVSQVGEHRWWRDEAHPLWDETKKHIVRIMGAAQDITERKQAEQHAQAMLAAQSSIGQTVRNHLRMYTHNLSSILKILTSVKSRDAAMDLFALKSRLQSILDIYEMIYSSKQPVGIERYVQTLTADLFKQHRTSRLTYRVEADPCELDAERTAHTLLMLRELLQNSLRHAYAEGTRGEITVEFRRMKEDGVMLRVADGGVGLRKDIDPRRPKSVGFHLVNHLARQLKGTLECERESGTSISVTFPSLP